MKPPIVLMSGPPASGKDTVTAALADTDDRFVLFDKLKVGGGRVAGYRMTSRAELSRMAACGLIIQSHERYGNIYAVDRPHLDELTRAGRIPVVHVGRRQNLVALRAALESRPVSILLWADRPIVEDRLRTRDPKDLEARLRAYDAELEELRRAPADEFDLVIRTDERSPDEAARDVVCLVEHRSPTTGVEDDLARLLA